MRRPATALLTAALAGATLTFVTTQVASSQSAATETVFVPIVPCRLIDTRPATNVGPRNTPIGANETATFNAHDGSDDDSTCQIPTSATAVSTNVTATGANAPSFLTLWPFGTDRPNTSNLNYLPDAPPTPNAVNLPVSDDGRFNVFNRNGTINVIIDANGYYQPSSSIGAPGPAGPAGPAGPPGPSGPRNRISDEQVLFEQWEADPARPLIVDVPDGPEDIASDGTHIFVTIGPDDAVVVIDPATGQLVGSPITVGTDPEGIVVAGGRVFVANSSDDTVTVIDPTTRTVVETIPLSHDADHVSTDGRFVYVVGGTDDRMSRIDPTTNDVVLPVTTTGDFPEESASDGTRVWVTNYDAETVTSYDPNTGAQVGSPIALPGAGPAGIAWDGTFIWVGGYDDGSLYRIDPVARVVVGPPITGFDSPWTLTYDGRRMYVTEDGAGDLSILDPASGAVIGTVPFGVASDSQGAFFDGSNVWVAGTDDDVVLRLHPSL